MKEQVSLNRRSFVKGIVGVGALGAVAGLSGCATPQPNNSPAATASGAASTQLAATDHDSSTPLWEADAKPNKVVVISDLHLGIADNISETVENRTLLVKFLQQLHATADVSELVLNGDIFDDWYLPLSYLAYSDPVAFYEAIFKTNSEVIDELNHLIESGVKVIYVPGNHDMLLDSGTLKKALPGIEQARDTNGLGVYLTGERNEIAIEHGHRYDLFSAPDTLSNAQLTGSSDTILPPGYFYARFAASWVLQGRPPIKKMYPVITRVPDKSDADQFGAYLYYRVLEDQFGRITPIERFEDKVFDLKIAGFNDQYTVKDFYPAELEDGTISAPTLFMNFQRTWVERQELNKVKIKTPYSDAIMGVTSYEYYFKQAALQHLENTAESVDLVVFGHTHKPDYHELDNGKIYINEGTWIDYNTNFPQAARTFAVITTGAQATAALYTYLEDGSIQDITSDVSNHDVEG